MRVLLDTHILYWWFYDTDRLSAAATATVRSADEILVSSASIWEIAIKVRLGKMRANLEQILKLIAENDFQELPISHRHASCVAGLPMHHNDPFDRLLISQAMTESLHLLTADTQLRLYSDLVLCA